MTQPALRFLEYVFLALLYLFFFRVIRAVWTELREPKAAATSPSGHSSPSGLARSEPPAEAGPVRGHKGRAMPQRLVVISPPQAKQATGSQPAFPLGKEITIGRAAECAVALTADQFVSGIHARLFLQGQEYWIEDLGSTNGTLVNGRKLTGSTPLRRGDRLQVGRTIRELSK